LRSHLVRRSLARPDVARGQPQQIVLVPQESRVARGVSVSVQSDREAHRRRPLDAQVPQREQRDDGRGGRDAVHARAAARLLGSDGKLQERLALLGDLGRLIANWNTVETDRFYIVLRHSWAGPRSVSFNE